ncbi:nuclear transport factor 2 family protein [Tunturiibacter lichenicola]|uniref:nuclear transport factor 2 family protein n=1 Tax=Tunturiibacter lichenicola TaxID=2051959 RepID=UPI0021B1D4B7|nr:nuclear transport factor 2 family protein [Edaphobacter lichenicola]
MRIEDHLRSLEEHLLDPAVRHNSELVASLLADDFIEFGSSGRVFNKASILEDLKNEPPRTASLLTDFKTRELAPDVILATYKATRRNANGDPIGQSWRSSIWAHVNGQWQISFHQGTPIPPDPTAPTP